MPISFKDAFREAVRLRDGAGESQATPKDLISAVLQEVPPVQAGNSTSGAGNGSGNSALVGTHKPFIAPAGLPSNIAGSVANPNQPQSTPANGRRRKSRSERGGSRFGDLALRKITVSPPPYRHLAEPRVVAKPKPNSVRITFSDDAKVIWPGKQGREAALLSVDEDSGIPIQLHSGKSADGPEVTIGLDFGTSSVKVVVSDNMMEQSFAVPFRDLMGVDGYLLPSRLHEADGRYSLQPAFGGKNGVVHRNLKLALLADAGSVIARNHVIAFLALVIRRARAWFFASRGDAYRNVDILWTLVLGVPAALAEQDALLDLYSQLGSAAWYTAGLAGPVSRAACSEALSVVRRQSPGDAIEVRVMPELAAQIQGFVTSSQFDSKASNLYLIADVGAGTVDSCLLHVRKTPAGSFDFELYTAIVEFNGVMNLHRSRVNWWLNQAALDLHCGWLRGELEQLLLPTDQLAAVPESFDGYFTGIGASFGGKLVSPDDSFRLGLLQQLHGKTAYRAYSEGTLDGSQISSARCILCGGGSRMAYYKSLSQDLGKKPNGFSWLALSPMDLVLPRNLKATGVSDKDFDRLSVAYGLSTLQMESMRKMLAPPMQKGEPRIVDWSSAYVDKDQT